MSQMGRPGLSAERKAELWDRWKNGQSLSEIGSALGKHAASIFGVVARNGGIAPATRRRSRLALTMSEREEISRASPREQRSARLQLQSRDHHRRSAERSRAMVVQPGTVPLRQNRKHGIKRDDRSCAYWLEIADYSESWRVSCNWIGHPSKLRVGSRRTLHTMGACACPTKRFTAVCSSRPAAS